MLNARYIRWLATYVISLLHILLLSYVQSNLLPFKIRLQEELRARRDYIKRDVLRENEFSHGRKHLVEIITKNLIISSRKWKREMRFRNVIVLCGTGEK